MKKVLVTGDYLHDSGETAFIMNSFGKIKDNSIQFDAAIVSGSNEMVKELQMSGWHTYLFPAANQNLLAHWRAWRQFWKEHSGEYAAVHFNYSAMWNFLPIYYAHKSGVPVITMHSHNTYFGTAGNRVKLTILRLIHEVGKRLICNYWANQFLAASKEAAEWLFTKNIVTHKHYQIVRNGIDLNKFGYSDEVRTKVRTKMNWQGKHVFANVGVFEPRKNHAFIIKTFCELVKKDSQAVLVLVGDGPLKAKIKQQVKEAQLTNYVQFLGVRNDLAELYQGFDSLLFPSLHEGLSLVFVEAQATGLQVFPSAQIPLDRYVKDLVHPLSLIQSASDWANAIQAIMVTVHDRHGYQAELRSYGYDQVQTIQTIQNLYSDNRSK